LFSAEGISIEALIQKAPPAGESRVPVIVLTNEATQGRLEAAVRAIEALDSISGKIMCIRVETLGG
jgi:homoserine dehydrogenase